MDQLLQIDVPAEAPSLRLVRLGTLDAAERAGMDCDGADDLRIGVEELCMAVLGRCVGGHPARLAVRFRVRDDLVMVHGIARVGTLPVEPELGRAAAGILAAVVDRFALHGGEGVIRFRLVKRRSPTTSVLA